MRVIHFAIGAAVLALSACQAPPSVQKVLDEKAEEEARRLTPQMDDPVLGVARETGLEDYNRYLLGQWAPQGACGDAAVQWRLTDESFARPEEEPCKLAVVEALQDGTYAIAGYCPRVETQDVAELIRITRAGPDNIIIAGTKGGPLVRCF